MRNLITHIRMSYEKGWWGWTGDAVTEDRVFGARDFTGSDELTRDEAADDAMLLAGIVLAHHTIDYAPGCEATILRGEQDTVYRRAGGGWEEA